VLKEVTADVLVEAPAATAAAIQAARGVKTILGVNFPGLGNADISWCLCSDGNELASDGAMGCFSAGIGASAVRGLDNSWVSFSYDPRLGAQVFADWVQELSNLD